jgi:hypothetical protein
MMTPITDEEIKKALFEMKPLKAPGPDGYQPFFYQSINGLSEILQKVRRMLQKSINFLVLIPSRWTWRKLMID